MGVWLVVCVMCRGYVVMLKIKDKDFRRKVKLTELTKDKDMS